METELYNKGRGIPASKTPRAGHPPAAENLLQSVAQAAVQGLAPYAQLAGLSQAALASSALPAVITNMTGEDFGFLV